MNNMQDLIETCYFQAKQKGFYSSWSPIPDTAYLAAIHDELSEAFEEWNKRSNWYALDSSLDIPKLTGIYVELTDAVIRIFSYCGYKGLTLKQINLETDRPFTKDDFCDVILKCHADISQVYDLLVQEVCDDYHESLIIKATCNTFSTLIARVERFIFESSEEEYNLLSLVEQKLSINKLRSVRHGDNKV